AANAAQEPAVRIGDIDDQHAARTAVAGQGLAAALRDLRIRRKTAEALVLVRADERAPSVLHDQTVALLDDCPARRGGAGLPLRAKLINCCSLRPALTRQAGLPAEWLTTLWRAALRIVRLTAELRLDIRPGPDRRTSAGAGRAAATPLWGPILLQLRGVR